MQNYKIDVLLYVVDGAVASNCADITFYNQGTTAVVINNGVTINAGQSLSISANANEIDTTIYTFRFVISASVTNKLVIFRKIYA